MPTYPHICNECQYEWEQVYSMKVAPPDTCPNCGYVGKVERLIGMGAGGRVELTGNELKEKVKEDSKTFAREVMSNEKMLANFVGEQKYHENELRRSKNETDRRQINKELHTGSIHRKSQ